MIFLEDSAVWLSMLNKRNSVAHIYNEKEADELILLIRDSFIPALDTLAQTLTKKLAEVKSEWD